MQRPLGFARANRKRVIIVVIMVAVWMAIAMAVAIMVAIAMAVRDRLVAMSAL
jgi:adenylylsulfate kinase-like enzyme